MKKKEFLVPVDKLELGAGIPCEIIETCDAVPRGDGVVEPCFHIRITVGVEWFIPVNPETAYILLSEDDVAAGKIPEVFD
ncbi:MAG: hypothetical protein HYT98_04195 [Candidatus Sungbacteria bacterium]|nr:hypothetical protein [Candidatus Sungbacteria bacterium]